MTDHIGRVAVLTGGAGGIACATARRLAADGVDRRAVGSRRGAGL